MYINLLSNSWYILFSKCRYYSTVFNTADQTLHIVFACLPLAWITGLLPPLDAFILWLFEQIHVFMLGGSPVSSDIRYIFKCLPCTETETNKTLL